MDAALPLDPPVTKPTQRRRNSGAIEALDLVFHGTAAFEMTPGMVVQAAKQDIESAAHNIRVRAERREEKAKEWGRPEQVDPVRPLAFVPKHVKGARTPPDVIRNAITGQAFGAGSQNPNTARLYNNLDLLKAALALCEAQP